MPPEAVHSLARFAVWYVGTQWAASVVITAVHHSLSGGLLSMTKATVSDLTVQRNSRGDLVPNTGTLDDLTDDEGEPLEAEVKPLVYGDTTEYFDDDEVENLGAGVVAELLDEKLVEPDLTESEHCPDDHVSEEFVRENLPPLVPRSFLMCLFEESGMADEIDNVEVDDDGSAEIEYSDGGN